MLHISVLLQTPALQASYSSNNNNNNYNKKNQHQLISPPIKSNLMSGHSHTRSSSSQRHHFPESPLCGPSGDCTWSLVLSSRSLFPQTGQPYGFSPVCQQLLLQVCPHRRALPAGVTPERHLPSSCGTSGESPGERWCSWRVPPAWIFA